MKQNMKSGAKKGRKLPFENNPNKLKHYERKSDFLGMKILAKNYWLANKASFAPNSMQGYTKSSFAISSWQANIDGGMLFKYGICSDVCQSYTFIKNWVYRRFIFSVHQSSIMLVTFGSIIGSVRSMTRNS